MSQPQAFFSVQYVAQQPPHAHQPPTAATNQQPYPLVGASLALPPPVYVTAAPQQPQRPATYHMPVIPDHRNESPLMFDQRSPAQQPQQFRYVYGPPPTANPPAVQYVTATAGPTTPLQSAHMSYAHPSMSPPLMPMPQPQPVYASPPQHVAYVTQVPPPTGHTTVYLANAPQGSPHPTYQTQSHPSFAVPSQQPYGSQYPHAPQQYLPVKTADYMPYAVEPAAAGLPHHQSSQIVIVRQNSPSQLTPFVSAPSTPPQPHHFSFLPKQIAPPPPYYATTTGSNSAASTTCATPTAALYPTLSYGPPQSRAARAPRIPKFPIMCRHMIEGNCHRRRGRVAHSQSMLDAAIAAIAAAARAAGQDPEAAVAWASSRDLRGRHHADEDSDSDTDSTDGSRKNSVVLPAPALSE